MGDRDEIAALVHRYAELIDAGDMGGVVAMFAAATWRSDASGAVLRTPEEIREVYDRIVLYEDGTPRTQHQITNVTVAVDGTTATARSSFTVLQGGEPGTPIEPILVGRYHDRYHHGPEGWHLADRLFIVDLVGDQSRHFPVNGGPAGGSSAKPSG